LRSHSSHADPFFFAENQIGILPEYVLAHLVHLLAYHPDFGLGAAELQAFLP
jgi:hypothetical protein